MELPRALVDLRGRVEQTLVALLDRAHDRLVDVHPDLAPPADELRTFVLGGGKRLRPLFVLSGYRAAGGTDPEAVLGPAAALELLHTCALLHDDIIDAAVTRRGRPTAHEAFARFHAEHGLRGDAGAFGRAAALLLGDLAFVHADEAFLSTPLAGDRVLGAFRLFTTLREEVTAGQYLDVLGAHREAVSAELALVVASFKSGRYSVARPLQVGAALAGAGEDVVDGLFAFGLPLGRAFQLRDDLLGVFGAEEATGKSVAGDLAEGKRTLLVAETLARLDPDGRERFDARFGRGELTREEAGELRRLMTASGGRAAVLERMDAEVRGALERLDRVPVTAEGGAWLRALAAFVRDRET